MTAKVSSKDVSSYSDNEEQRSERVLRDKEPERYQFVRNNIVEAELYHGSLKCLSPSRYLNDEVVQFYVKYLYHDYCSPELSRKIHIFDNIFHRKLGETFLKDQIEETKWRQLNKWMNSVDLFDKNFLIIPVCQEEHWFVIIVCYPSEVRDYDEGSASPDQSSDSRNRPVPGIIVMDSLGLNKKLATREVREFLDFEWRTRITVVKDFFYHNLEEFHPKLPKQTNAYDCGIFMLAYLKAFTKNPDRFYRHVRKCKNESSDVLNGMVNDALVDCSRESIKMLILRHCTDKPTKSAT